MNWDIESENKETSDTKEKQTEKDIPVLFEDIG
jgi:hypothetical protein